MKLSQNFSLRELTKSQTAERKGISNEPSEEHIENLKLLCTKILQPIRDEWVWSVYPRAIAAKRCAKPSAQKLLVNMLAARRLTLNVIM